MLKTTAFIGYGFVGKACHKAFENNTEAIIIDPKYSEITIADLPNYDCKLAFVSIFAPTLDDGSVDASVIYSIFQQLTDIKYAGLVVLKSTLPPDIVDDLYIKFGSDSAMMKEGPLRYIYSPEFLREATWEKDAIEQNFMITAGNFHDCAELKDLYKKHSSIPAYCRFFQVDYKEASLAKYAINSFLATKVAFMNQIYRLYMGAYGIDRPIHPETWKLFTDMIAADMRVGQSHLQVPGPDGQFGYGGTCFPKDVKAFIGYDKNNRLTILREVEQANTIIRLTGTGKTDTI
jgi:UDPglucose 6-dehydrogenase